MRKLITLSFLALFSIFKPAEQENTNTPKKNNDDDKTGELSCGDKSPVFEAGTGQGV
ncbi:MAG: hypothetical protein ACHQF4_08970 [Sphingobacteriales bacterium]